MKDSRTEALIKRLAERGQTLAVAESVTGGLLTAELTRPAGASAVVRGGVVAYATDLKDQVLGVDRDLLDAHGPAHPTVAIAMALCVRKLLSRPDLAVDVGISTTGVAGPETHGGQPVGTVFIGLSIHEQTRAISLALRGTRDEIRESAVRHALLALDGAL